MSQEYDEDLTLPINKKFETDSDGNPSLEGLKSISRIMGAYAGKNTETTRYLVVKDGVIKYQFILVAGMPSESVIKTNEDYLRRIGAFLAREDAGLVLIHNHPSGFITPSEDDIKTTGYLENFFRKKDGSTRIKGHIILDHGDYGLYMPGHDWVGYVDGLLYPVEEIEKSYRTSWVENERKAVFNPDMSITDDSLMELAGYARECDAVSEWNKKDWIPALIITKGGVVRSFEQFNIRDFSDVNGFSSMLKKIGKLHSADNIIFFPRDKKQFLVAEGFAYQSQKVMDVFLMNEDGSHKHSDYRNGTIFNDMKMQDIRAGESGNNKMADSEYDKFVETKEDNMNVKTEENRILAEKTTSFVTGRGFSRNNMKKIGMYYSALKKEGINNFDNPELISDEQIAASGADPSVMTSAVLITVPVAHSEPVEFQEVPYTLLSALPEEAQNIIRQKKAVLQQENESFFQKLNEYRLPSLSKSVIASFIPQIEDFLENSNLPDGDKDGIRNLLESAEADTSSKDEAIRKNAYKTLRLFWSLNTSVMLLSEDSSFRQELSSVSSAVDLFSLSESHTRNLYLSSLRSERHVPEAVENLGLLRKLSEQQKLTKAEKKLLAFHENDMGQAAAIMHDRKENVEMVLEQGKFDLSKVICFDTETTGRMAGEDELLQVSITNGYGKKLFSEYVKPEHKTEWKGAMIVNHISPKMVKDKPHISEFIPEIQKIFDDASLFVSYNGRFDVDFLEAAGIKMPDVPHLDVIKPAASITKFPVKSQNKSADGYGFPKLTDVAGKIGFDYKAHDSLGDTLATLAVAKHIYGDSLEKLTDADIEKYDIDPPKKSGKNHNKKKQDVSYQDIMQENIQLKKLLAEAEEKNRKLEDNLQAELDRRFEQLWAERSEQLTQEIIRNVREKSDSWQQQLELQNNAYIEENQALKAENASLKENRGEDEVKKDRKPDTEKPSFPSKEPVSEPYPIADDIREKMNKEMFTPNSKIPRFGHVFPNGKKPEIINGAVFSERIVDEENPFNNQVILLVTEKDGKQREIQIGEREYIHILEKDAEFQSRWRNNEHDRDILESVVRKRDKDLILDYDKLRANTAEHFLHNFRIHCKSDKVNNHVDVHDLAKWMYNNMTPYNKNLMDEELRHTGSEDFYKGLYRIFEAVQKEKNVNMKLNYFHNIEDRFQENLDENDYLLKVGAVIPETSTKVGDVIPISFTFSDPITYESRHTPKENWKILKVTDKCQNNQALLFNQEKNMYTQLPLGKLQEFCRKVERIQARNERRNKKKDLSYSLSR